MCVMTAMAAASTVISAVGAITDSQHAASADKYNASVAEQNSVAVQQQAESASLIQQEQAKKTIGTATANYGASGVTLDGSPMDVLANSASVAERDRQNIIYKGQLQAAGYQDQASLDRAAATNSLDQGYMKATGILISGGTKAYGMSGSGGGSKPSSYQAALDDGG